MRGLIRKDLGLDDQLVGNGKYVLYIQTISQHLVIFLSFHWLKKKNKRELIERGSTRVQEEENELDA